MTDIAKRITQGEVCLGIELGSTRIKAVLIDKKCACLAQGGFEWENRLVDGVWTYDLEEVWRGLRECFSALCAQVRDKYGVALTRPAAIGISAMMHGYLAFDGRGGQLSRFRTWRNTMTSEAAEELTRHFNFSIPQRWSVAHLYQAVKNGEPHVRDIDFLTTLAGYVHWRLTGEKVLGIGDASGMFPIDSAALDYDAEMCEKFDSLCEGSPLGKKIADLLPKVLVAGESAGRLTKEGAALLDPTGALEAGIPLCPPEGDAGTGMTATNSVSPRTGNVSAGTSVFAMLVLERPLSGPHAEIDMVTTPAGDPVAMVHCNNCTGDLDAWAGIFAQSARLFGREIPKDELYEKLYLSALDADFDCGGLVSGNYFSGEHITGFSEGRPFLVRTPDGKFNIPNLMRSLLFSCMATLRIGMDVLTQREKVSVELISGHGGLFKTKAVGQRFMASALNTPVSVSDSAGEGGAWGIATLAAFMADNDGSRSLGDYLESLVFAGDGGKVEMPTEALVKSFEAYMERYRRGLAVERTAVEML